VPSLEGEVGATLGTLVGEGRQAALERVAVRRQLQRLRIEAPEPFTLNLDGEPVEHARFDVDCVPRWLRMHLPADCPLLAGAVPAAGDARAAPRAATS
jgi:diacylglycerol kinase family enzyme